MLFYLSDTWVAGETITPLFPTKAVWIGIAYKNYVMTVIDLPASLNVGKTFFYISFGQSVRTGSLKSQIFPTLIAYAICKISCWAVTNPHTLTTLLKSNYRHDSEVNLSRLTKDLADL